MSLLSAPSSCTLFDLTRLAVDVARQAFLRVVELRMRPERTRRAGTVMSSAWKLRLNPSGICVICVLSMMRPVSVRSVCSIGASPVTMTDSSNWPTARTISTRTVVLTLTSTPSRENFLKPTSSPSTR